MAVYHTHIVNCVCGNALTVQLADSINANRSPEARERILRGELHRASCPACGRTFTVEKPFYYTDLGRNVLFKVSPRGERHEWKARSRELENASSFVPTELGQTQERTLRVVFGMDELREKLVAQDAKIDDWTVEALKVLLVYEHPFLLRRARLRLVFDRVTETDLEFVASYEHSPQRYRLQMPRRILSDYASTVPRLKSWLRGPHARPRDAAPDHWVNLWRWSPQPTALKRLRGYAESVEAGKDINTKEPAFQQMLTGLPRGSQLPAWAKRDLRRLFEYAKLKNLQQLEDTLFELRFGFELENDWSTNANKDDIDTLWTLLKDLPDTNVEGNTKIHEILLDVGQGGGLYDPQSHDITIGSNVLGQRERFEDVVRHEVGHAVHEKNDKLVTAWLEVRFGWKVFDSSSDAGIDGWVDAMDGWETLTPSQRADVRGALRTALGAGQSWNPGPTPFLPNGHPWTQKNFGPRLAFEATGASWYNHFQTWYRAKGKAFFLNYWYRTLLVVDESTLALVEQMPDSYAAMSHYEFFAELYALYYDLDDPLRSAIPGDVGQWIDTNLGAPETVAPMPAAPAKKLDYETVTRPKREKSK